MASLALHLAEGGPPPASEDFPIRLIPGAAQRAVDGLVDASEERYRAVRERAFAFAASLPRPQRMGAEADGAFTASRVAYLRGLVEDLTFGPPAE